MNIVTVSENPLITSGVSQQMNLIINLFEENNKIVSLSLSKCDTTVVSKNWVVCYCGETAKERQKNLVQILENEKIDYLIFMTDPRFFTWVMPIEYRIKTLCSNIFYYHVWDERPAPVFNKSFYNVFDHIACISELTYGCMKELGYKNISYIPHTLPDQIFEMSPVDAKRFSQKFTVLWDSRNQTRKSPASAIEAFAKFHKKHPDSFLVMKTDQISQEGCDVSYLLNYYDLKPLEDCVLICEDLSIQEMNSVYNACDVVLITSIAEGFGLSALMGLKTGRMVIAPQIGGLQDQIDNKVGYSVKPEFDYNFASLAAPVLNWRFVAPKTYTKFLEQAFYAGKEKRQSMNKYAKEKYESKFSKSIFENNWKKIISDNYKQRNLFLKNFVNIEVI